MSASSYLEDYGKRWKSSLKEVAKHVGDVAQDTASELVGVGKTFALTKTATMTNPNDQAAANSALDIFEKSAHKLIGKYEGSYENWTGVTGASDCGCKGGWIGSAEMDLSTAKDYIDSKNAKTKDNIIDEIIKVVDSLGLKVSGSSREEKVKSLLAAIPAGDKFNSSNEAHRRICNKIAEALNSIHGNQIINTTLAPELVCQQVAEIVSSLAAAMHSEFLAVYSDVKKILKNLEVLRKSIIDDNAEVKRRIDSSDDPTLIKETAQLNDLHIIITDEIERQIQLLQNMLNITLFPAERELASLIKGQKDIYGYIEKIDTKPGNKGFGKVISDILKGLGVTANFALLIDRALKSVGISVDEYVKTDSVSKLREKITAGLMGKELNESKLHEYLQAAELLYKNFYRKEDIANVMSTNKIGNFEDNIAEPGMSGAMLGGADRYAKTALDKRITDRRKLRNLIFTAFYRRLDDIYTALMTSMETLAKKVGSEIPLSDQLDNFRYIVQRIDENLLRSKNVYQALIGYYSDALSKNRRDSILADLKMVSSQIDTIVEMSAYQSSAKYFKDVQSQINALFEVVNKYSDEIAAKFGKGEDCEYIDEKSGEGESAENKIGGDEFIDEPKTIIRSAKKIIDSFRKFDYYYKVAQIRANLGRTSKELDSYGEKYDKLVANSIAQHLESKKFVYEKFRKYLSDFNEANIGDDTIQVNGVREFATIEQSRAEKANALKFLDMQWEATKKFWATVEAIDTYMRVFTNGLVKNPNDVQDIKSMLNEVEVVSNWYNEAAGDGVAQVFDMFPSFIANTGTPNQINITYPSANIVEGAAAHYYEKFASAVEQSPDTLPGNPFLTANATQAVKARDMVKKTMMNLSILKNLISVFVHIGSKFGGVELKSKIFMSPAQIYNNLVEFLQASAFQQGWIGTATEAELNAVQPFGYEAPIPTAFINGDNLGCKINANMSVEDASATHEKTYYNDRTGVLVGPSTLDNNTDAMRFRRLAGVIMAPLYGRLTNGVYDFSFEGQYFITVLKAIAAKILTVTGMYDVLDRPLENNAINPIRMIIGGVDDTPKVDENVTELYLRLPLLAQFYKKIFGYDEDKGEYDRNNVFAETELPGREDRMIKISLVPDFDGVFAGFIRLLFRQIKYVGTKSYNESDVKSIVREINLIYQRMQAKYPQNTISETINEFVAEVNRRYGIMSRDERNKFENAFGYRYDYFQGNTADTDRYQAQADVDVAILPGEDEDEIVRPSGAEKLLSGEPFADKDRIKSQYGIKLDHINLLKRFRCAIDKVFENHTDEHTFKNAIKHTIAKLKKESDDEKRLSIVAQLIRGKEALTKSDELKYFMFHETVVTGLNTLSALHTILSRFKRQILIVDLPQFEQDIMEYLSTTGAAGVGGDVSVAQLSAHILGKLNTRVGAVDAPIDAELGEVFGEGENNTRLGGADPNVNKNIKHKLGVHEVTNRDATVAAQVRRLAVADRANYPLVGAGHITVSDNIAAAVTANRTHGLLGVLAAKDITVAIESIKTNKNLTNESAQALQTVFRYLFNQEFVMKTLLESVFAISNDTQGLITMKIDNGRLLLNFGPIKALVEELFTHVSYFLDVLRPYVSADLIKKYTEKTNPGSFYWLQEQLMEKLVYGRPEEHALTNQVGRHGYINIDDIGRKVDGLFIHLTKVHQVDGRGLRNAGLSAVSPAVESTRRNTYDKVFAELVFYNSAVENSGLRNNNAEATAALIDFKGVEQPYETLHFAGVPDKKMLDTRFIIRFKQLYSWDKVYKPNRSLLFSYNQMVAKFIRCFYDNLTQKMYSGLIVQQLNGPLNRAINDYKSTYPDVVPAYIVKAERDAIKYPNTQLFEPEINRDAAYSLFRQAIKELLTRGIGNYKSLSQRTALLDPTNAALFAEAGVAPFMPLISRYLLLYMVAIRLDEVMAAAPVVHEVAMHSITNAATLVNVQVALNGKTFVEYVADADDAAVTAIFGRLLGAAAVAGNTGDITRVAAGPAPHLRYTWNALNANITATGGVLIAAFNRYLSARLVDNISGAPRYTSSDKLLLTESAKLNFPFYKDMVSDALAIESRIELFCAIVTKFHDVHMIAPPGAINAAGLVIIQKRYSDYRELVKKSLTSAPTIVVNKKAEPRTYLKQEELLAYLNTEVTDPYIDFATPQSYVRVVSNDADGHAGPGDAWKFINEPPRPITRNEMLSFGRRIDPDEDHVLYTSLSVILKTLFLTRNAANNTSIYLIDNIADVNQYMKERFRANLPLFKMYFKEISDKCEFLRQTMGQGNVYMERAWTECGGAPTKNPWPFNLLNVTATSEDTKRRFTSILSGISAHAKSFMTACDQVMRELSDDPKFMELSQGFIKDYKSQYSADPLMPLSSVLTVFRNVHTTDDDLSLPVHFQGDKLFKFVYGSRLLLNQPSIQPLPDHVPGWSAACEQFNMMIDTKQQADKTKADAFMKAVMKAVRFVYGAKFIRGNITPFTNRIVAADVGYVINDTHYYSGMFARDNFIVTSKTYTNPAADRVVPIGNVYKGNDVMAPTNRSTVSIIGDVDVLRGINVGLVDKMPIAVYGISKSIDDTIQITEGGFKDDQMQLIINHLLGKKAHDVSLEVQNIIDLNIVPINVHALMREIPLVNIYNYSYTFERLVIELYYGPGSEMARGKIKDLCDSAVPQINDSRDLLVRSLINPYGLVTDSVDGSSKYYSLVRNMMLGNASMDLGRPKFLSDQLLNKSLFGEMYEFKDDYNEVGPANKNVRSNGTIYPPDALIAFNSGAYAIDALGEPHREFLMVAIDYVLKNETNLYKLINKLSAARDGAVGRVKFGAVIVGVDLERYAFVVGWLALAIGMPFKMMLRGEISAAVAQLATLSAINVLNSIVLPAARAGAVPIDLGFVHTAAQRPKALVLSAISAAPDIANPIAQPANAAAWPLNANATWQAVLATIPAAALAAEYTATFKALVKMMPLFDPVIDIEGAANGQANADLTAIPAMYESYINHAEKVDPIVSQLHWLDKPSIDGEAPFEPSQVKSVPVGPIAQHLHMISRMRYDTVFVRNLVFIVNLYRTIRHKLQKDLTYNRDIVASSQIITKPSITEFSGNQTYETPASYSLHQRYRRYQY